MMFVFADVIHEKWLEFATNVLAWNAAANAITSDGVGLRRRKCFSNIQKRNRHIVY